MNELVNIFLKVVRDNYANFDGRARRREYWMFYLANVVFYAGMMILGAILGSIISILGILVFVIMSLAGLALFVPSLALTVRRLHDTGKSGWFVFISLIPLIGGIWLLILLVTEGISEDNEYGKNPKEIN